MKVYFQTEKELTEALTSTESTQRDKALKQLLLDPVVIGKIRDLINFYKLPQIDADEILQEGLILLDDLVRTGKFRGESSVRTFLISICKNMLRNDLKKVNRIVLKDSFTESQSADEGSADAGIVIEEKTEMHIQRDNVLRKLMENITDRCKEVLNLQYFKAFSMIQIAAQRGLANAEQAKKAASQCREQLRKLILEDPSVAQFLKESI